MTSEKEDWTLEGQIAHVKTEERRLEKFMKFPKTAQALTPKIVEQLKSLRTHLRLQIRQHQDELARIEEALGKVEAKKLG